MLTRLFIFSVLMVLGAVNASNALAIDYNQLHLKSLVTNDTKLDHGNENLVTIAMIYQPGCKWCKKQGKALAKIQHQCAQYANIALIGADGKTQTLRRELRHFDKNLPAFEANKKFLLKIQGVEAYPTTVVFDKKGKLIAKKRGYIAPKKLAQVMALITEQRCDSVL